MSKAVKQTKSGRRSLILLILLFAMPLVLAYYMSRHLDEFDTFKTKNYGDLVVPARPLSDVMLNKIGGGEYKFSDMQGKWILVYIGSATCDKECEQTLYKMRQSRLAQGGELKRVARLYISLDGKPKVSVEKILQDHPGLEVVYAENRQASNVSTQFYDNTQEQQSALYVVDPLGNLMMRYPKGFEAKGLVKDLAHLLKASQVG